MLPKKIDHVERDYFVLKSLKKREERMSKHTNYSHEFKFKVSLELIRGDLTLAEVISKYKVPRSVLGRL